MTHRRLVQIDDVRPCCVCGTATTRADVIVGVIVPWCDFDWWTYVVRRIRKPIHERTQQCSS